MPRKRNHSRMKTISYNEPASTTAMSLSTNRNLSSSQSRVRTRAHSGVQTSALKTKTREGSKSRLKTTSHPSDTINMMRTDLKALSNRLFMNALEMYGFDAYRILESISAPAKGIKAQRAILAHQQQKKILILHKSTNKSGTDIILEQLGLKRQMHLLNNDHKMHYYALPIKVYRKGPLVVAAYQNYGRKLSQVGLDCSRLLKFIEDMAFSLLHIHRCGLVHGSIEDSSIYECPRQAHQKNHFKLGGFTKVFPMAERKQLLRLGHNIQTPPEIINYKMFQAGIDGVSRHLLDFLHEYRNPSAIDVWSLGVAVAKLLGASLSVHPSNLLEFQCALNAFCLPTFRNLPESLSKLLSNMLSPDPTQRPRIKDILRTVQLCRINQVDLFK